MSIFSDRPYLTQYSDSIKGNTTPYHLCSCVLILSDVIACADHPQLIYHLHVIKADDDGLIIHG